MANMLVALRWNICEWRRHCWDTPSLDTCPKPQNIVQVIIEMKENNRVLFEARNPNQELRFSFSILQ